MLNNMQKRKLFFFFFTRPASELNRPTGRENTEQEVSGLRCQTCLFKWYILGALQVRPRMISGKQIPETRDSDSAGLRFHPRISTAAAAAKSLQWCLTLCDPRDGSPPGSPVPGIFQARVPEEGAIAFSESALLIPISGDSSLVIISMCSRWHH